MKHWYRILNISPQATGEEVKQAYRKLAKEYHPDAHPNDVVRAGKFKEVSEAYRILSDSEKRKTYDRELHTAASGGERAGKQGNKTVSRQNRSEVHFETVPPSFEDYFFGFDPEAKKHVNEEKRKAKAGNKNPLDAGNLFEKFMGIKR